MLLRTIDRFFLQDRPERAIYQPGAARRRAAAQTAASSNATGNNAPTSKEKPE